MGHISRAFAWVVVLLLVCMTGCVDWGTYERPRRKTGEEWVKRYKAFPRMASNDPKDWNVYIEVENVETSLASYDFGRVSWVYRGSDVAVGGGGPMLANNGIRVGVSRGRLSAAAIAGGGDTRGRRTTTQFLTVLNGQTAYLDVSDIYTEPMTIVVFGHHLGIVGMHYFVKAGATLEVRPTIVGDDMLDVEITPVISSYDRGARRLALQELRTRVRVRDGQSIIIGGIQTERATFGSTFFSRSSASGTMHRTVILTPTILK